MKASLFIRERDGLRFNPYFVVGAYELCIDSDGILLSGPRRSCGYIRGSGFWQRRHP